MLLRVSRNEADRRAVLTTLGPVWDGNEVWLLVAGGATFAAFLNGMQRSLVASIFHYF